MIYVLVGLVGLNNVFTHFKFISESNVQWAMHMTAVETTNAEVWMGKTLPVDSINQYGFYPHMLAPIFQSSDFRSFDLQS